MTDPLAPPLLDVRGLTIALRSGAHVIDGIDFTVEAGKTLALVGESGAGKSLTALAIMGLLPPHAMQRTGGSLLFEGVDLAALSERELRGYRGGHVAMIFQDPLTALNPVLTVERQLTESIRLHTGLTGDAVRRRALELLDLVGIPAARSRLGEYPHRLSGGMRQRVMIAIALAGNPRLILADEPTTALDVTISAQVLDLLASLQREFRLGMLFITHDLRSVRALAHDVAVMYSGRIVETGTVVDVFRAPVHPYTEGLLKARPNGSFATQHHKLREIPGTVPSPDARPPGCAFAPRCGVGTEACTAQPPETARRGSRAVACFHPLVQEGAA